MTFGDDVVRPKSEKGLGGAVPGIRGNYMQQKSQSYALESFVGAQCIECSVRCSDMKPGVFSGFRANKSERTFAMNSPS
jgi:hypothetical protein